MAMIETDDLRKSFGAQVAVAGLSFTVAAGETFGLLGPNGAGKSTAVRMLTGLLRPGGGRAAVAGYDVVRQRSQVMASIGVVFEFPALYPRLTVEENLGFVAALGGTGRTRVDAVIERLGLGDHRHRRLRLLSKGWRQRAVLAGALLAHPRILFLDEPTSGLDPNARAEFHAVLRSLRDEGVTILVTTHDMAEAAQLCDRVGILHKGRLVALDAPAALVERLQGQRIRLSWWEAGALREASVPLDDPATPALVARVLGEHRVLNIETTGSLDEVYRRLTNAKGA